MKTKRNVLIWAMVVVSIALFLSLPRGKAQNNGNGCVASSETNYACGSIATNGEIDPTYFCVNQGSSVPLPGLITPPSFNNGTKTVTTTRTDCSTTNETTAITYSAGPLQYDPAPPNGSTPGTYTSSCYIIGTPSDTHCDPTNVPCGSVTWNVVDTNELVNFEFSPSAFLEILNNSMNYIRPVVKAANCQAPTNLTFSSNIKVAL